MLIAGHDVVADSVAAKRQLAFVPDDPKLFDMLTVWEHLQFMATAYRVADFEPRATALLEQFELLDNRDKMAQELSRGMRQKVAVACAYLHDPQVILFDEPLTGLDPRHSDAQRVDRRAGGGRRGDHRQLAPTRARRRPLHAPADSPARAVALLRADPGGAGRLRHDESRRLARRTVFQGDRRMIRNPALIELARLRRRGTLRRLARLLKSPRGILLSLFGLLTLGLIVGPNFTLAMIGQRADPTAVRTFAPWGILVLCLWNMLASASDKAITFTMPEVEFLFPGPFTRTELLLYKLGDNVWSAVRLSLLISLFGLRWSTWWIAGWVGLLLTILFIQLFTMSLSLIVQVVGERAYNRWRRLVVVAVVIAAALMVVQGLPQGVQGSLTDILARLRESMIGRIVLAPFDVFVRTITAQTLAPEFVTWGSVALAIDVALAALVLRLDANYLEAATVASQKRYELISRARRGRMPALGARHTARWRLPQFPWLAGAGPIAWRQGMQLLRGSLRVLLVLFVMSVTAGPMLMSFELGKVSLTAPIISMVAWLGFFVTTAFPCGFRADLENMDTLKMLPIAPWALVTGELAAPVLFVTLLQCCVLVGFAASPAVSRPTMLAGACFTLPANLLLVAIENMLFLWFPARVVASSPGDFQTVGRQMLLTMVRMFAVMAACAVAGAVVWIAYLIGIESWLLLGLLAWLILMLEGSAAVLGAVRAFRGFDPSLDMPA